jgi:hypothetical protein
VNHLIDVVDIAIVVGLSLLFLRFMKRVSARLMRERSFRDWWAEVRRAGPITYWCYVAYLVFLTNDVIHGDDGKMIAFLIVVLIVVAH